MGSLGDDQSPGADRIISQFCHLEANANDNTVLYFTEDSIFHVLTG